MPFQSTLPVRGETASNSTHAEAGASIRNEPQSLAAGGVVGDLVQIGPTGGEEQVLRGLLLGADALLLCAVTCEPDPHGSLIAVLHRVAPAGPAAEPGQQIGNAGKIGGDGYGLQAGAGGDDLGGDTVFPGEGEDFIHAKTLLF